MKKQTSTGFGDLLTLLFIYLKLTNQINWSWIWVLSPIWIVVAIALIIAIFNRLGE